MPASKSFLEASKQLKFNVEALKINSFYYYIPFVLAQAEDPEVKFDYLKKYDIITVEYQNYKRFYWAPFHKEIPGPITEIAFDYPNFSGIVGWEKHEVDRNYINSPKEIVQHQGKKFHEFRHALNVFEKAYPNRDEKYEDVTSDNGREVIQFLVNTLLGKESFSEELMLFNTLMKLRKKYEYSDIKAKVLRVDGMIWSLNVWGELYPKCGIHLMNKNKPDIPFLSDYSRFLFYDDIKDEFEIVNDGSDLDDQGLARFKRKFNPIKVISINSWAKV